MKMHKLVLFEYFLFTHYFEGENFISTSKLDKFDSTKGTVAESGEYLKIIAFEFSHDLFAVFLKCIKFVFLHNNKQ